MPIKPEPEVLRCSGINKAIMDMKNDFTVFCLYANHIAPNTRTSRESRRRQCAFPRGRFGLFATPDPLSIMTAICVVQCEPWVQQARTPKASEPSRFPYQAHAAIPHSLFHLGFMHWVMKASFFPVLWITYWNPAVEEWFKNSLNISLPLALRPFHNRTYAQRLLGSVLPRNPAANKAAWRISFEAPFNVRILERCVGLTRT